jgi:TorA maturation chaperone TorD
LRAGDDALGAVAHLLRLLGFTWLLEPDAAALAQLATLPPLAAACAALTPEAAALEYAEAILQAVPPYASLFLDDTAMLNAAPAELAAETYARYGFEVQPEWRAGPADHLGLELLFLAVLWEHDAPAARAFLSTQLLIWAPVCCLAVERLPHTPLYAAIARLSRRTLVSLLDE